MLRTTQLGKRRGVSKPPWFRRGLMARVRRRCELQRTHVSLSPARSCGCSGEWPARVARAAAVPAPPRQKRHAASTRITGEENTLLLPVSSFCCHH